MAKSASTAPNVKVPVSPFAPRVTLPRQVRWCVHQQWCWLQISRSKSDALAFDNKHQHGIIRNLCWKKNNTTHQMSGGVLEHAVTLHRWQPTIFSETMVQAEKQAHMVPLHAKGSVLRFLGTSMRTTSNEVNHCPQTHEQNVLQTLVIQFGDTHSRNMQQPCDNQSCFLSFLLLL